ncbi:hypothetical protein QE442_001129 [Chryseobacterium sp. SORGH_AS1175]|nr:hypothetical protein [Chryseobacterium sp. SORGH_AS_1175]
MENFISSYVFTVQRWEIYSLVFKTSSWLLSTVVFAGISRYTVHPAPIIQLSPMVTPFKTVTLLPSQQLFPILIGEVLNSE